ncbi:hypothetical protein DFH09DRAFT_948590 [Mycena vulgaris]|nr:hypothetical protein DFH09DRAFT_948590 [Mycena vulgaris]
MRYTDKFTSSCLVGQGLIPCAPWTPNVAFSTRLLELFRVAHLRTPGLSIQAWVKTLSDVHGVPFKPYRAQQLSIAYDLYLAILGKVKARVDRELGRDAPDWRMKNCCPSCTYKLEGEQELIFSMLVAMDGNDSLKRVLRKEAHDFDDDGNPLPSASKERHDPRARAAGKDYFLSREKVDAWSKEVLAGLVDIPVSRLLDAPEEKTACEERWKNLSEDLTKRMWAIYDETGVFVCLCRHGFVVLIADMVRSGELAKYGLAISNALAEAFGRDVGGGYDVGCGFNTTVRNSPLGPTALLQNLQFFVGAFHGHAHNRLCQLQFLVTYVLGMGVEDLEGCERFFSKSNAMAGSVRYASVFHRLQTITTYLAHHDTHETYANLSKFLVDNYWQALDLIQTEDSLKVAMVTSGIESVDEFHHRLAQELHFLRGLTREPESETRDMEYYQRLVNLKERQATLDVLLAEASTATAIKKRHALENYDKALDLVQESEVVMGVEVRWLSTGQEWSEAAHLVSTKRYQTALNRLELLVVQRMFELTKMNMSQTGYKLRKHIAKALQARSQAIRNALKTYNAAAAALIPPGRKLEWTEVVDYAFLADFDILRNPGGLDEIRPWAVPAARLVLDRYFKIERAREEITRCNVEIRRLVTYIRDEQEFLGRKERECSNPGLAWCIRRHRLQRERYDEMHLERFAKLATKAGPRFTGTLEPGVRLNPEGEVHPMDGVEEGQIEAEVAAREVARQMELMGIRDDDEDIDDDLGERMEGEQLAEELHTIYGAAEDL